MKTAVFVFILNVFPLLLQAQGVDLVPNLNIVHNDEQIQISSQKMDCVDKANGTAKQYFKLTVWNKSETPLSISFKKELWFDGVCSNCSSGGPEHTVSIEVDGGDTVSGGCGTENRSLTIFSKMLELKGVRALTHFELKNLEIENLDQ
jgi:hypothetical protein